MVTIMDKISQVLSYILYNYPYPDELSKTRCTKMIYLADWSSVLKYNKQITDIEWYFGHYGPYVDDVYNIVKKSKSLFFIQKSQSYFGNPKEIFRLNPDYAPETLLNNEEKQILDDIIEKTQYLNWNEFVKMVYETYPIESQKKYNHLNLIEIKRNMINKRN